MRAFSNRLSFHRNNLRSAFILSCTFTMLADVAYADIQHLNGVTHNDPIAADIDDIEIDGGTVILNPTVQNTYTGNTMIDAGILEINSKAIPTTSTIIFDDDTTLYRFEKCLMHNS